MTVARPEYLAPAAAVAGVGIVALSGAAWLATPAASALACLAIAFVGLPHGALDIDILTRARRDGQARFGPVLALYLGCAALMAGLWWAMPVAALALFIIAAVVHFGEDWAAAGSLFLERGLALALLAAPALGHRTAIAAIFVALTGTPDAARIADLLLMAAPVAGGVAVVAVAAMVANGDRRTACAAAISLGALLLLPPAPAFAVYFCLFHSPRHLRAALQLLGWTRPRQWLPVVVPVTAAALGIATLLYLVVPAQGIAARLVAAVFMTLSIVTLPHLMVPPLLAFIRSRRQPRAMSISAAR